MQSGPLRQITTIHLGGIVSADAALTALCAALQLTFRCPDAVRISISGITTCNSNSSSSSSGEPPALPIDVSFGVSGMLEDEEDESAATSLGHILFHAAKSLSGFLADPEATAEEKKKVDATVLMLQKAAFLADRSSREQNTSAAAGTPAAASAVPGGAGNYFDDIKITSIVVDDIAGATTIATAQDRLGATPELLDGLRECVRNLASSYIARSLAQDLELGVPVPAQFCNECASGGALDAALGGVGWFRCTVEALGAAQRTKMAVKAHNTTHPPLLQACLVCPNQYFCSEHVRSHHKSGAGENSQQQQQRHVALPVEPLVHVEMEHPVVVSAMKRQEEARLATLAEARRKLQEEEQQQQQEEKEGQEDHDATERHEKENPAAGSSPAVVEMESCRGYNSALLTACAERFYRYADRPFILPCSVAANGPTTSVFTFQDVWRASWTVAAMVFEGICASEAAVARASELRKEELEVQRQQMEKAEAQLAAKAASSRRGRKNAPAASTNDHQNQNADISAAAVQEEKNDQEQEGERERQEKQKMKEVEEEQRRRMQQPFKTKVVICVLRDEPSRVVAEFATMFASCALLPLFLPASKAKSGSEQAEEETAVALERCADQINAMLTQDERETSSLQEHQQQQQRLLPRPSVIIVHDSDAAVLNKKIRSLTAPPPSSTNPAVLPPLPPVLPLPPLEKILEQASSAPFAEAAAAATAGNGTPVPGVRVSSFLPTLQDAFSHARLFFNVLYPPPRELPRYVIAKLEARRSEQLESLEQTHLQAATAKRAAKRHHHHHHHGHGHGGSVSSRPGGNDGAALLTVAALSKKENEALQVALATVNAQFDATLEKMLHRHISREVDVDGEHLVGLFPTSGTTSTVAFAAAAAGSGAASKKSTAASLLPSLAQYTRKKWLQRQIESQPPAGRSSLFISLQYAPMYHFSARSALWDSLFFGGARCLVSAAEVLALFSVLHPTGCFLVPGLWEAAKKQWELLQRGDSKDGASSGGSNRVAQDVLGKRCVIVGSGTAALPKDLEHWIENTVAPAAECRFKNTFGSTEMGAALTSNGFVAEHAQVELDENGLIWCKHPSMFDGYYGAVGGGDDKQAGHGAGTPEVEIEMVESPPSAAAAAAAAKSSSSPTAAAAAAAAASGPRKGTNKSSNDVEETSGGSNTNENTTGASFDTNRPLSEQLAERGYFCTGDMGEFSFDEKTGQRKLTLLGRATGASKLATGVFCRLDLIENAAQAASPRHVRAAFASVVNTGSFVVLLCYAPHLKAAADQRQLADDIRSVLVGCASGGIGAETRSSSSSSASDGATAATTTTTKRREQHRASDRLAVIGSQFRLQHYEVPLVVKCFHAEQVPASVSVATFDPCTGREIPPEERHLFTVENGLLTPTFKLKRMAAAIALKPLLESATAAAMKVLGESSAAVSATPSETNQPATSIEEAIAAARAAHSLGVDVKTVRAVQMVNFVQQNHDESDDAAAAAGADDVASAATTSKRKEEPVRHDESSSHQIDLAALRRDIDRWPPALLGPLSNVKAVTSVFVGPAVEKPVPVLPSYIGYEMVQPAPVAAAAGSNSARSLSPSSSSSMQVVRGRSPTSKSSSSSSSNNKKAPAPPPPPEPRLNIHPFSIFLTGATGHVGAAFVSAVLEAQLRRKWAFEEKQQQQHRHAGGSGGGGADTESNKSSVKSSSKSSSAAAASAVAALAAADCETSAAMAPKLKICCLCRIPPFVSQPPSNGGAEENTQNNDQQQQQQQHVADNSARALKRIRDLVLDKYTGSKLVGHVRDAFDESIVVIPYVDPLSSKHKNQHQREKGKEKEAGGETERQQQQQPDVEALLQGALSSAVNEMLAAHFPSCPIDIVVHGAAEVDMLKPYSELRGPNVLFGSILASLLGARSKRFVLLSTASVMPLHPVFDRYAPLQREEVLQIGPTLEALLEQEEEKQRQKQKAMEIEKKRQEQLLQQQGVGGGRSASSSARRRQQLISFVMTDAEEKMQRQQKEETRRKLVEKLRKQTRRIVVNSLPPPEQHMMAQELLKSAHGGGYATSKSMSEAAVVAALAAVQKGLVAESEQLLEEEKARAKKAKQEAAFGGGALGEALMMIAGGSSPSAAAGDDSTDAAAAAIASGESASAGGSSGGGFTVRNERAEREERARREEEARRKSREQEELRLQEIKAEAAAKLCDLLIVRIPFVWCHSETGASNLQDTFHRFALSVLRGGAVFDPLQKQDMEEEPDYWNFLAADECATTLLYLALDGLAAPAIPGDILRQIEQGHKKRQQQQQQTQTRNRAAEQKEKKEMARQSELLLKIAGGEGNRNNSHPTAARTRSTTEAETRRRTVKIHTSHRLYYSSFVRTALAMSVTNDFSGQQRKQSILCPIRKMSYEKWWEKMFLRSSSNTPLPVLPLVDNFSVVDGPYFRHPKRLVAAEKQEVVSSETENRKDLIDFADKRATDILKRNLDWMAQFC